MSDDLVQRLRDASLVIQYPERSKIADRIEALEATLERQQLSYEREREIDQEEIERLLAQRRGDANALRMIADALGVPEDARHDGGIMRAITKLADAEVLDTYGGAAAVLAMRERCASACEDEARLWEADGKGPATEARPCAARIRSLA